MTEGPNPLRAVRVIEPSRVDLVDIDEPTPGAGELVIKIAAAGVCHSDVHLRTAPEVLHMQLPLTLGHEVAGTVHRLGPGVDGFEIGQLVAVYPLTGCGTCVACMRGQVNLCRKGFTSIGVHRDGGLAEYMLLPSENAVDATGIAPEVAAPLTDAGLTSYHAVRCGLDAQPNAQYAMVIGIGGLGHLAVQELTAESPAQVIAVDIDPTKLDLARRMGAHTTFRSGSDTAEEILAHVDGRQIDLVIDFVGSQATVQLASAVTAPGGSIITAGLGGGTLEMTASINRPVAHDVDIRQVAVGGREDLARVLSLARSGSLSVEIEVIELEQAAAAIERLDRGDVRGRIVVVP